LASVAEDCKTGNFRRLIRFAVLGWVRMPKICSRRHRPQWEMP